MVAVESYTALRLELAKNFLCIISMQMDLVIVVSCASPVEKDTPVCLQKTFEQKGANDKAGVEIGKGKRSASRKTYFHTIKFCKTIVSNKN